MWQVFITQVILSCCCVTGVSGGVFGDRHKLGDVPILWELIQSSGVDGHTHRVVVLVVCDQPLESSEDHCTSDMEVPMALVGPLLPDDNDIQLRGKAGQTVRKGGHILREVDNMPTVPILSLGQSVH